MTFISLVILVSSCVVAMEKPRHFKPLAQGEQSYNTTWLAPTASNVVLSQRFRPPSNKRHRGVDLAGDSGQAIYATRSGKVVYAGRKFRGYGRMILVEHDSTWTSLYSHLSRYEVRSGQRVKQGQVIGYMGRSGRASGVHLHFEIYKNKLAIDPLSIVPIKYRRR